jgi:hypothetical protein
MFDVLFVLVLAGPMLQLVARNSVYARRQELRQEQLLAEILGR